jgi:hypothetical protein
VTLWLCVAPLRLGGLRGKKSTPSVWLGGTGGFLRSASRSSMERGQEAEGKGMIVPELSRSMVRYCSDCDCIDGTGPGCIFFL